MLHETALQEKRAGMQWLSRMRVQASPAFWAWLIIGLGSILRVAQYLSGRSLWLDEAKLALNIVNRSFSGLLQPLDYDQGAPVGFLMLEKLAVQLFGPGENSLRLLSLFSGILALVLVYPVATQFLESRAVPVALALFAVLDNLIYYSSEVKQYSTDVACALLILFLAMTVERKGLATRWLVCYALVGAALIWLSHPAIFILAGVGLVSWLALVKNRNWIQSGRLAIVGALFVVSFIVSYRISLNGLLANQSLVTDWSGAFFPFPPRSLANLRWPIDVFFRVFDNPIGLALPGLGAAALIIGAGSLWFRDRSKFFLLSSPILVTLFASALRMYPFSGRLLFFLVPILLLFIAEGAVQVRGITPQMSLVAETAVIGLLLFHPTLAAAKHLVIPRTAEEIRPVLDYVSEHRQESDVLYVYYSAQYALAYYSQRYQLSDAIIGIEARSQPGRYLTELDSLRGNERVWFVFSHVYNWQGIDEEKVFLDYLDRSGTRLDSFASPGAKVYLYDLGFARAQ